MRVLVVGSGGREHALCWCLKKSPLISALYSAPGNPGIGQLATIIPTKVDQILELADRAAEEKIDLTIVGPEIPLSLGIVDEFQKRGLRIFGPSRRAAEIEASKSFAKEVMIGAGVPTAECVTVTTKEEALSYIGKKGAPIVLKADGLAAGKGVFVCKRLEEAFSAVDSLFQELKAKKVVIEEFLEGVEVSFIVATNGTTVVPMASSHDYKRIFDNDEGPNTGGMGTVSPTPRLSEEQAQWVIANVITPVINEMARRGSPFTGFLYAGLMISSSGKISVLEFNARMGDPECQSILRRLDSDLLELLYALSDTAKQAKIPSPTWSKKSAVCVVLASDGYPSDVKTGDVIEVVEFASVIPECVVFHAGTAINSSSRLVTSGGRVLNVTALGSNLEEARSRVYKAADLIQFRGRQGRRDIGR